MTLKQLWSVIRGRRTNYRLFGISWTYYPDGDPLGKILMASPGVKKEGTENGNDQSLP